MNSLHIKTKTVLDKIKELEESKYSVEDTRIIDSQIWILKEILKPQ